VGWAGGDFRADGGGWGAGPGFIRRAVDCRESWVVHAVGCDELGALGGAAGGDAAWDWTGSGACCVDKVGRDAGEAGRNQPGDGDREDCADCVGDGGVSVAAAVSECGVGGVPDVVVRRGDGGVLRRFGLLPCGPAGGIPRPVAAVREMMLHHF